MASMMPEILRMIATGSLRPRKKVALDTAMEDYVPSTPGRRDVVEPLSPAADGERMSPERYEEIRQKLEKTGPGLLNPEIYKRNPNLLNEEPVTPDAEPSLDDKVRDAAPWLKDDFKDLLSTPDLSTGLNNVQGNTRTASAVGVPMDMETGKPIQSPDGVGADGAGVKVNTRVINAYMDRLGADPVQSIAAPKPDIDLEADPTPAPQQRIIIEKLPEPPAENDYDKMLAQSRRDRGWTEVARGGAMINEGLTGVKAPHDRYDEYQKWDTEGVRDYVANQGRRREASLRDPFSPESQKARKAFAAVLPDIAKGLDFENNQYSAADLMELQKGPLPTKIKMDAANAKLERERNYRNPESQISKEKVSTFKQTSIGKKWQDENPGQKLSAAAVDDLLKIAPADVALQVANLNKTQKERDQDPNSPAAQVARNQLQGPLKKWVTPLLPPGTDLDTMTRDELQPLVTQAIQMRDDTLDRADKALDRKLQQVREELARVDKQSADFAKEGTAAMEGLYLIENAETLLASGKVPEGGFFRKLLNRPEVLETPGVSDIANKFRNTEERALVATIFAINEASAKASGGVVTESDRAGAARINQLVAGGSKKELAEALSVAKARFQEKVNNLKAKNPKGYEAFQQGYESATGKPSLTTRTSTPTPKPTQKGGTMPKPPSGKRRIKRLSDGKVSDVSSTSADSLLKKRDASGKPEFEEVR